MTTRRSFLGRVAGGAAAAASLGGLARAAGGPKAPLGLQLWSVRASLKKDVPGTLRQVKEWGFDEVETFDGFGAEIAPQLKAAWEQGHKERFHPYGKTIAQTLGS